VLTFCAGIGVYIFKDKITNLLVQEINKRLATEIQVGKIDLTAFSNFPNLSLKFSNVKIKEPDTFSKGEAKGNLVTAKTLFFTFNPIDLLRKNYQVEQITLQNAKVDLKVNKEGKGNFYIFKRDSSASNLQLSLNLKKIRLEDVIVNFKYAPSSQYYSILQKKATARFSVENNLYSIALEGNLFIYDITIAGQNYIREKAITISSQQVLSTQDKYLKILPSKLVVGKSVFDVKGQYDFKNTNHIDLSMEGEKGKLQTLVSLLPSDIASRLENYESEGDVFFSARLAGAVSETRNPLLTVYFGFDKVSIMQPETKAKIENATLRGYFTNGEAKSTRSSLLKIDRFSFSFQGKSFSGAFQAFNFHDPFIQFQCKGDIDLKALATFYPIKEIKKPFGNVSINLSFAGKTTDFKTNPQFIHASGEITLKNTAFKLINNNVSYTFSGLKGIFLFNRNDVAVTDFSGSVNTNDFLINGYFKNLISLLFFQKNTLLVNADFTSSFLNLDALLPKQETKEGVASSDINLLPLKANLRCKIGKFKYQNLVVDSLEGLVNYANPILDLQGFSANFAGGSMHFDAHCKQGKKSKEINTKASFSGIKMDSLFYAFNNFDQTFLTEKNIKGVASGAATLFVPIKDNAIDFPNLLGNVKLTVKDGELNAFTPMQKLSLFIEEKDLYNIRFSELSNDFIIKENKIIIPEMWIKSSISNIKITGEQTFDNTLDYKLTIPLKNFKKKKDRDEAFGAIEDDGRGNGNIFLTLKGPADNFKIGYDTRRTGEKIKNDFLREKKELSDILKNRHSLNPFHGDKNPEVNQDEYFNF